MKMAVGIDIGETKIMAGSILQLKEAVQNADDWRIATLEESLYMESTASAKSIGIDGECGMIANGYDADFIALIPELELTATYLEGVCRFQVENLMGKEGVR
ncbi:amidohydrolase family protein [Bacillus cereus]|uniref:amidohydrolase family protein n=1 Tax=Bacillus cereus TaxID=1396 RepID=UPI00187A4763|nr:amidohydrolase family protein [Bacillus cereus]MBE7121256.1 amidohydrolase family protein [Bacillus cereus]